MDCITKTDFAITLKESVRKIAKANGFDKYVVNNQPISTKGGNYLGELYLVDIKSDSDDVKKELNLFVKKIITCDEKMDFMPIKDVYAREILLYDEISKIFEKLQEDEAIPNNERVKFVKCYDAPNCEALVMQNMNKKGYFTYDKRNEIAPMKFVELAVKNLARYHAMSFVIQHKLPKYFENNIKTLKPLIQMTDNLKDFSNHQLEINAEIIDCEWSKRKLLEYSETMCKIYEHYLTKDHEISGLVLCHGDYRTNNILVKSKNGEFNEVIPVDYQLIYFGDPVIDLIYFIYGATDTEFRKKHIEDIKNLYYKSMSEFLTYFNLDVGEIYPRKLFEESYSNKIDYGLIVTIFFLPILLSSEDSFVDLSEDDLTKIQVPNTKEYRRRINDGVKEFIDLGIL